MVMLRSLLSVLGKGQTAVKTVASDVTIDDVNYTLWLLMQH
jgi:hypothetical protein